MPRDRKAATALLSLAITGGLMTYAGCRGHETLFLVFVVLATVDAIQVLRLLVNGESDPFSGG